MIELTVFLSGCIVMSYEILGSRVLAPHFGSSVFVWGSIIGVFLGGLTAGYWAGGHIADYKPSLYVYASLFGIPGLMLTLFPLYADPVCAWIFDLDWDVRYASLLASMILFFAPSVFLGAVSPYAIKLRVTSLRWLGSGVGNLYALSSMGSIVGTLFTTFYLITWMGIKSIIRIEGLALIALAAAIALYGRFRTEPGEARNASGDIVSAG